MVTDSPSDKTTAGDGGKGRQSPVLRYGDIFDEFCGFYLSIGMSYDDYWNGDATMTKYYRQMYQLRQERKNRDMWLQGAYIYEALVDVAAIFNPLSTKRKPFPYRDTPIPLTQHESEKLKELNNQKRLEKGKEAMKMMMAEFNRQFKEKQKEGGEPNNGD